MLKSFGYGIAGLMLFFLALTSVSVQAEYFMEIDESYTNGQSAGKVNGGIWTPQGWKTKYKTDYIQYDIETCAYGKVEFDVVGLYASNVVFPNVKADGSEDMHYTLFNMYDRDPNDAWYGKYVNGFRMWHNPYKAVMHVFGYVKNDPWKWQHGRFRLNVAAFHGGYEDDPNAFEIEYGPVPWEKEHVFHVRLEWGQGHMYYYIDDVLYAHADYSSFGTEYAPPYHSLRVGSSLGAKAFGHQVPIDITFSNFKFYRNEDRTPPEVVSISPSDNSNSAPLDSYIAFNMSESLDPTSFQNAFRISPPVNGTVKLTGNTIYYELNQLLSPNTTYTVSLTTDVMDYAGNNLLSTSQASFTTGAEQATQVEKYGIFELPIVATGYVGNKYKTPKLHGVFQGPTQKIEIDGFWNGGDIWKIRMAPTEVGQWTYTITGTLPAFNRSGSFTVIESNSKGFIHKNPALPYTFMWDDGTPWLWKGETSWRAYTSLLPYESRYKDYIDLRAAQGYNAVQSIVVSYINGDAFWANEGGTAFQLTQSGKDYDNLNPGYYQWIDRRLEYANSKGIVPVIFFTWAQEFVKFSDAQFKLFVEYMVARWAAYNVMWVISGEHNEAYGEYGLSPDVYKQHGITIAAKDPYDHPVSLHPSGRGSSREFAYESWYGFIMQQWPIDYHQFILNDRTFNKPTVNSEYAYADWHDNEDVRRGAWDIFTAGGFFTAGFFHTFAPDKGGWDLDANQREQQALVIIMDFIEHTHWWAMNPHDELVTNGYCIADPGNEYVVYARNGGAASINLAGVKGDIDVRWLNPITGEYTGQTKIAGGGITTLTPPFTGEWVLHVGGYLDFEPPAAPGGIALQPGE